MTNLTDEFEIYKLYGNLEIWKAAALIMGIKPSEIEIQHIEEFDEHNINGRFFTVYKVPEGVSQGMFDATMGAIISNTITKEQEVWSRDIQF